MGAAVVAARRRKGKPYKSGADSSNPTHERMERAGEAFEIGGDERTGKIIRVLDSPLDGMLRREMVNGVEYAAPFSSFFAASRQR